jgi:glycosyltransferase involved in cell wall biosynthesis
LTISPAIAKDATDSNWKLKAKIFEASRLWVATPSRWLMDKVMQSMLQPAIVENRVIPNGVDLTTYKPGDQREARAALGIQPDAKVLLFTSNWARNSPWRDFKTLQQAVGLIAERLAGTSVVFLALGETAPSELVGKARIDFVPYQKDPSIVARYYQAADVYLHASRTDTFPNVILEAQACGCPVVATGVGGIPEQIDHGRTGFIVPAASSLEMAEYAVELLAHENLHRSIREAALSKIRLNNDWRQVARAYLAWFEEIAASQSQDVKTLTI